jgi:hypothetical protein
MVGDRYHLPYLKEGLKILFVGLNILKALFFGLEKQDMCFLLIIYILKA